MRAWLLHFVFAAILVGSLAAKDRKIDVLMESNILAGCGKSRLVVVLLPIRGCGMSVTH